MFLNRTIKIKPVTIVNSAFILILISSMLLSIALPKRASAAPFEGNLQDKFTQYNLLVGFAVNCGLDGGGDRDVTQDDVDNVYDTDAGDDNNGYGADDYESDAGRQINIGYSASGYNNINGMTSCEDIVVHVLDSIIDYHEIDIGGPSNDEEGKSYIVNFLLDDLGGNKNDIIEHLEDNDGTDQLEDIFAVDDKVKLANGAWRDFVSNFMEPMYKDLEEELRADATETDIANWLAPALNYCLDWVDSPPASSDATRIDLSAKAGLYGRYPVDGWNTERMRRLFGADFRVGDDGTIVGGKDWADIAGGQFNFLFRDFARYASVDGSNFADAFAEKLNFLADLTYFINPISLFFGGPDDDKEGYFFPFGYASYIFFNDVPLSRSNGQDGFRRGGLLSCQNIEENLDKWDDGIEGEGDGRSVRAKTPDPDSGVVIPDDPGAIIDTTPSCESEGGAFSFIVCPLLKGADAGFDWFNDRITAALNVNEDYYGNTVCPGGGTNCPDSEKVSGVRNAWANFRNIAYLLLIPTMLILVIGTALGFQFLDAYTVKRAMPRLLVAIIFIAVSFDVTRIMVELSNTVGQGIAGLIAAPFGGLNELSLQNIFGTGDFVGENIGEGLLFTGIAVAAAGAIFFAGVTIGTMLITLGIALLSVIIIFAILSLREMLVIFLMVISPIAILAWIFPGNDKPWKLWWGTFTKLLLFFPVVIGVIVTGRAFAYIVNVTDSDEGIFISTLIKLAAFVGPYFFIPALFKFAGGALGNLAGMVNDRSKGVFDRAKKSRSKTMGERGEQRRRPVLAKRADYAARLKDSASDPSKSKASQFLMRRAASGIGGYNVEAKMSEKRAQVGKEINEQIATGRDEEIRGLAAAHAQDYEKEHGIEAAMAAGHVRLKDGKKQYRSAGGAWINESDVVAGRKRWGDDVFAKQAALSYEMRKAQTSEEVEYLRQNYSGLADSWDLNPTERAGVLKGAGYENQNNNLLYKYMKEDGSIDMAGMTNEIYEKRGSYPMTQQSASVVEAMNAEYGSSDAPTQARMRAIAETFTHRSGGGSGVTMVPGEDGADPTPVMMPGIGGEATGRAGYVQTTGQGAGHFNEVTHQFANTTGVFVPENPPTPPQKEARTTRTTSPPPPTPTPWAPPAPPPPPPPRKRP